MATRPGIKIRYKPVRTYRNFQANFPGSQADAYKRGWRPQVPTVTGGIDGTVDKVLVFGGLLVFAGDFTFVGGTARSGFAAVSVDTGLLSGLWDHAFSNGTVQGLGTDGTYLYVGGDFTSADGVSTINGNPVHGLVRFDRNGVLDETWNPALNNNPDIDVIEWNRDNGTVYIGGDGLASVGGFGRAFIAEVSTTGAGTVTAWNPDPDQRIYALAVDPDRDLIYMGGHFQSLGGIARNFLARVAYDGTIDSWDPNPDFDIYALLLDGTGCYVGGFFANIGVTPVGRGGGAFIDDYGEARAWDPLIDISIKRIAKYRNTVFLAGDFTSCDGSARNGLAAINDADHWIGGSSDLDEWDPAPDQNDIRDMAILGRTIYAAGKFTSSGYSAQAALVAVPWPVFTDANSKFVSKAGSDAAAGTEAAPLLTIQTAQYALGGSFRYVVVLDSETYDERLDVDYSAGMLVGGLFAADGQEPTLALRRGAIPGTYGARVEGRTKFSSGAAGTFYFVAMNGDNSSGARGNPSLPFRTVAAALADAARVANDTIQVQDDGVYTGDLNIGSLAVTIQAADGHVPTFRPGAGATHIDASAAALTVYGINFAGSVKTSGRTILTKFNLSFWDCSFSRNYNAIELSAGAAGTLVVEVINCFFQKQNGSAIHTSNYKTHTLTARNCHFLDQVPTAFLSVIHYGSAATTATLTWDISRCTFENCARNSIALSNYTTTWGTMNGSASVSGCIFKNTEAYAYPYAACYFNITANTTFSWTVDNCYFTFISGQAVRDAFSNLKGGIGWVKNCVADRCGKTWFDFLTRGNEIRAALSVVLPPLVQRRADFHFGSEIESPLISAKGPLQAKITDCVSLHTGSMGFYVQLGSGAGALLIQNCVSIGAGDYGFLLRIAAPDSTTAYNLAESGSRSTGMNSGGVPGVSLGTFVWQNCIAEKGISGGTQVACLLARPFFLSQAQGEANCGMSAISRGINMGNDGSSAGISRAIVTVSSLGAPFMIDGFRIEGDANFDNGIAVARGLSYGAEISQCTFSGLGPEALRLASSSMAEHCLFNSPNGIAVNLSDGSDRVMRSVINGAGSAGVYIGETGAVVENITARGCEFGQFDASAATALRQRRNVYSGNGTLDYSGINDQAESDVPNLSDDASVTDGTRANPLFRDLTPDTEDLRLQAIAEGFNFDSPAKGLASDDSDAGAYDLNYGIVETSWTTFDFGSAGNDNPFHVERKNVPINPREGTYVAGASFSGAQTTKREWTFSWESNSRMAAAQVTALVDIYETGEGECQIDLGEGEGWIACRRLQSDSGIARTEAGGLSYADDSVDTPIRSMTFREST